MQPDLDKWWAEQAARKPKRFQLWRPRHGRLPAVLLRVSDDVDELVRAARKLGSACRVIESQGQGKLLLEIRSGSGERGPLARDHDPEVLASLVAEAEALRRLEVGAKVRQRLGLTPRAARRAAAHLRAGCVRLGRRSHPLPGGRGTVYVELGEGRGGGELVVSRNEP